MNADKTYDEYWSEGKNKTGWSEEDFVAWLGPVIGKHAVLDYGCGMGYSYQKFLREKCAQYTGADVSDLVLGDLRGKGLSALKISDSGAIDAADSTFDAVVCCEVMEHLWDPLAAARELHRVLKPGGTLVATVPNFGYLPWRLLAAMRARVWSEPEDPKTDPFKGVHIRFFSKQMFERLFRFAGFNNVTMGHSDRCNIFDIFYAFGPMARIGHFLSASLPKPFRLKALESIWPSVFAQRLRAICVK